MPTDDGNDDDLVAPGIPRKTLEHAAIDADIGSLTALRILAGYPTRMGRRERLLHALAALGCDTSQLPAPMQTGRIDTDGDDVHRGRR